MKVQKQKQRKPNKPVAAQPTFVYISVCCNAVAEKPECRSFGSVTTRIPGTLHTVTTARGKESETQGLGSWRCKQCRKACSCIRSKYQPVDKTAGQAV